MRRIPHAFFSIRARLTAPETKRILTTWKKYWIIPCLAVAVLGIFLATHPAWAQDVQAGGAGSTAGNIAALRATATNLWSTCSGFWGCMQAAIGAAIAFVLGLLVMLLGFFITVLVDVLMVFASYNHFGDASVVGMGWVIVRDVVNMFFIIMILVSAFSTIIGYESNFHYTKVLPKLLLMAILINFSRTLILLLVDFSQVVMLTFVNAFRQSAAGNFVKTLGLQDYLSVAASSQGTTDIINVIISYMLALTFLVITIGVLSIMIAFLIARIVGLWICIIVSPFAFFTTALPARLQKAVSSLSQGYWEKLTALLSGGPIMAFFLWLTLATVQAANNAGGITTTLGFSTEGHAGASGFITNIGNSQAVATFVVGIAMLLIGLQSAIAISGQVSESLGKVAGGIWKATKGAATWAAKAPFRLGVGAAKLAGKGAIYGGGKLLQTETGARARAEAARMAMGVTNKIPGLRGVARPFLAKEMQAERLVREEKVGKAMKGAEGFDKMSRADQDLFMAGVNPEKLIAPSNADRDFYGRLKAQRSGPESIAKETKARAAKYEQEMTHIADPNERKRAAEDRAMEEVTEEARKDQAEAKQMFKDSGNTEELAKLKDLQGKNPQYIAEEKEFDEECNKIANDKERIKNLDAGAASNVKVILKVAKGAFEVDATGKITGVNEQQLKQTVEQNPNTLLAKNALALANLVRNSPGGVEKKEVEGARVMLGATGDLEVYRADGRVQSGNEKAAMAKLITEFGAKGTGGREASGELTTGGKDAVTGGALIHSLPKVLKAAGDDADGKASETIGRMVEGNLRAAIGKKGEALQKAVQNAAKILSQANKPGVSSSARVTIMAGAFRGGLGKMLTDKETFAQMSREFRENAPTLVESASDMVELLQKKTTALTAEEAALVKGVTDLKTQIAGMKREDVAGPIRSAAGL